MRLIRTLFYPFYHRRHRKYYLLLFISFILILSSSTCYWCAEIEIDKDQIQLDEKRQDESREIIYNTHLNTNSSILLKYIRDPYNIDVWSIVTEANRKYQEYDQKYLVYSCPFMCGGWGDRTRKIIASFLLSLALNRTFIIDMTWPCSIERVITPNLISWSISSHIHIRNMSSSVKITSLSHKSYSMLKSYHEKYSVMHIQTKDIRYFDLLSHHPQLYQPLYNRFRLEKEHVQITTLYPLFYELLIKLKAPLQEKLDRLNMNSDSSDSKVYSSKPLLCGHIRLGRNPSNPKDDVFPQRENMNTTVLKFLLSRTGRVFITTDSTDVQQLARKLFSAENNAPSRLIEINGTIAHIDRDWNYLGCGGLEKTVLDFHALSYCDLAVISKSSFGHLAILRRINPYDQLYLYCNGIRKVNDPDDYNRYKYATC